MALFSFLKGKKPEATPPASGSTPPPPIPTPSQSVPPQPTASAAFPAGSSKISKKIVPRQGSLAAALKAASSTMPAGPSATQSAVYKPKVSVVIKPQTPTPAPPGIPVLAQASPSGSMVLPANTPPSVDIPTSDILPYLPEGLIQSDSPSLPATLAFPSTIILPQLATGKVQVPLQTVLALFPTELINQEVAGSSGDISIKIPLQFIIPRLPESVIALPMTQARQQVDENIEMPFAERSQRTAAAAASTVTPPVAAPAPALAQPPIPTPAPAVPTEAAAQTPKAPSSATPPMVRPSPRLSESKLSPDDAIKALTMGLKLPTRPNLGGPKISQQFSSPKLPPPSIPSLSKIRETQLNPQIPPQEVTQTPIPSASSPVENEPVASAVPPPTPVPAPQIAHPVAKPPSPVTPPASAAVPGTAVPKPLLPSPKIASASVPPTLSRVTPPATKPNVPLPAASGIAPPSAIPKPLIPKVVSPTAPAGQSASSAPAAQPPTPQIATPIAKPFVPSTPAVAAQPLAPVSKTEAPTPAEPVKKGPSLGQLLGITEQQDLRIQDLVEQIRKKWNLNGVVIATGDGLPIVSSVPADIDMHIWSRVAPLLFRKFDSDEKSMLNGKPRRTIVSSGGLWFSIYFDGGIFLILIHPIDSIQKDFEERNTALIQEIARQHQKQLKAI
jgi:predicted regulator of Ras-like GTPase activity (Roadblock/LC7/MglB family)